jgi:hypothetical protein
MHHANISLLFNLLDPVHEKPELEAQVEQAEEALWIPGASHHYPWLLFWINTFVLKMIVR